ncbi:MAG: hypothetical protein GPJ54_04335 [Candidatus Heimdallarchaeota archaeon]|nr:hypothetical protein [Candidatus Heimdallarchaeota archaeon]
MVLLDKINKLNEEMRKFSETMNNHQNAFSGLNTNMVSAITKLDDETRSMVLRNDELNAERNSLGEITKTMESRILALKQEEESLQSKVKMQTEEQLQLSPKLEDLKGQIASLTSKIENDKVKVTDLQDKLQQKISNREFTETETKDQIDAKQLELDTAKTESQDIIDKNVIWDFLKSKIDSPEIDILSVIAGTRNISSDEIKKRASSISAVLITRSISKLEADGKIVATPQGNWDLAPPLLAELEK